MSTELLLESHLKSLRLSAFLESYQALAHEAARTNLSYERYLTSARTRKSGALIGNPGKGYQMQAYRISPPVPFRG